MLASALLGVLITGPTAFALQGVDTPPLTWTSRDAVLTALDVPAGVNVFEIETAPLEARLLTIPSVADAHVSVALPDRLAIRIEERTPILVWSAGQLRFLADRDGVLFAILASDQPAWASLTTIVDSRAASTGGLGVGSRLDPVDLDVATRLGALRPADVGSASSGLVVNLTDATGWSLATTPSSWTAIFGFYSPGLRSTDLIPGQVRLLKSLLAGRESTVLRVILADPQNGTYVAKPSPR